MASSTSRLKLLLSPGHTLPEPQLTSSLALIQESVLQGTSAKNAQIIFKDQQRAGATSPQGATAIYLCSEQGLLRKHPTLLPGQFLHTPKTTLRGPELKNEHIPSWRVEKEKHFQAKSCCYANGSNFRIWSCSCETRKFSMALSHCEMRARQPLISHASLPCLLLSAAPSPTMEGHFCMFCWATHRG